MNDIVALLLIFGVPFACLWLMKRFVPMETEITDNNKLRLKLNDLEKEVARLKKLLADKEVGDE